MPKSGVHEQGLYVVGGGIGGGGKVGGVSRVRVRCKHCGHEWESEGTLHLVTCPSCGKKTPRVEAKS